MPLYNAREYVERAVNSILAQSYSDYTFLVVNDGSTDGSEKLVEAFKDERLILWHQANSGLGTVVNRAIEYANERGIPYLARMDADDISMPNRIEVLLGLISKNENIAGCSCNCQYIDVDTDEIIGTSVVPSSGWLIRWEILHGLRGLIHGACVFRTQALNNVGGYRSKFVHAEDTDLFLRLAEKYEFVNASDFLYQIRLNPRSLSVKNHDQNVLYQLYAHDCYIRRQKGMPEMEFTSFESFAKRKSFKIWRERKLLELWRDYMNHKNMSSLIMASVLSPNRVAARILRALDRKN